MKHYKLAPFCLVLLLAVITCGCSWIAKLKARDELNKGVAAYRNGQFQAAIMHFKESVRLDPTMISSRLYLATAYRQQYIPSGESEDNVKIAQQALDAFEDVLKMDPNNVTAIASIAQTYFDMRKFDKAKEYQKRRLQLDPNNPEPYYWIAVLDWTECFTRAGELRKDLKINFPTDPKDPGSLPPIPEKARTKLEEDNGPLVKEALDALDKAIQLKPNDFDTMAYLNLMYRQKAEIESNSEARAADLQAAEDWTNKALAVRKAAGAGTTGASQ